MRVNLLFGFLGSGKTTLVRHLLAERGKDMKTAVIVNEFGEVGVDGDILRGNSVDIVELNSGCLCCTLKGSLMLAVEELRAKANVERVIVEATGVAQPGELTETLADASMKTKVDIGPLVTVVDSAKFPRLLSMLGEFYAAQIENADIVILNKADLISPEGMDEVSEQIREMNPHADILFAQQCDVDTEILLARRPSGLVEGASRMTGDDRRAIHARVGENGESTGSNGQDHRGHHHDHTHEHHHDPHADAPAHSLILVAGGNPHEYAVRSFLSRLPSNVWRAKGFMTMDDKPWLIQYTMGQIEITPAAGKPNEKIVFIGRNMNRVDLEIGFAFARPY